MKIKKYDRTSFKKSFAKKMYPGDGKSSYWDVLIALPGTLRWQQSITMLIDSGRRATVREFCQTRNLPERTFYMMKKMRQTQVLGW